MDKPIECSNPKLLNIAMENYARLLQLGWQFPIRLELGPGKFGPQITDMVKIGLNPSADPGCEIYWNLENGIPLPDGSVIYCHSNQVIEHLKRDRFIGFMNDLFRVMVPGGKVLHCTPHFLSPFAAGDPTHCNLITEATFLYFCTNPETGQPFVADFSDYGITANFILDKQEVRQAQDITIYLRKPE